MTYTICSEWTDSYNQPFLPYRIQEADLSDGRGHTYRGGAQRVVDDRTGHRCGQVFKGETAWSRAESLARDLLMKERYAR